MTLLILKKECVGPVVELEKKNQNKPHLEGAFEKIVSEREKE